MTLAEKSAGHIGCRPDEITIDHENDARVPTWEAMCHNRVYVCAERGAGGSADDVACAPKLQ